MVIFMFGIVLTIVLFIAMGFVRGEGMSWRVNKKQLLALVGVLVIVFSCYVSIPAGHTGVVTTFGSVENYTLEACTSSSRGRRSSRWTTACRRARRICPASPLTFRRSA